MGHLSSGDYKKARDEWFVNKEYDERKARIDAGVPERFDKGIVNRFERFGKSIEKEGKRLGQWREGGLIMDSMDRRLI